MNDYRPNPDGTSLFECENTRMCCFDDQVCLPNLLCMEPKTGAVTREYCQSADWPEDECSQLCMEFEPFGKFYGIHCGHGDVLNHNRREKY